MKTFRTEALKPRIWLDQGVMISLDPDGISAVLYRKGFFSGWKVVNESTSMEDIEFTKEKINESLGKSIRIVGTIEFKVEPDSYRQRALMEISRNRLNNRIEDIIKKNYRK